jgi:hypothetical protein
VGGPACGRGMSRRPSFSIFSSSLLHRRQLGSIARLKYPHALAQRQNICSAHSCDPVWHQNGDNPLLGNPHGGRHAGQGEIDHHIKLLSYVLIIIKIYSSSPHSLHRHYSYATTRISTRITPPCATAFRKRRISSTFSFRSSPYGNTVNRE